MGERAWNIPQTGKGPGDGGTARRYGYDGERGASGMLLVNRLTNVVGRQGGKNQGLDRTGE